MRILLVDGAPQYGGQARHVFDLARGLRGRGHDVWVSCNHEKFYKDLKTAEIPTIKARFRQAPDLPTILELSRAISKHSISVVHTHGVRAGVTGRIAAKVAGCNRIVHTVHTMSEDLIRLPGPVGKATRSAYMLADRWLANWTDVLITVSGELSRRTINEGVPPDKVVTIHSGVDTSRYEQSDKTTARNKLGLPTGCTIVCTAARFTRQKNLGDFLRAAKAVSKRLPDVCFALIGDGEEGPALRRLAQDLGISHRVHFAGYRRDLPQVLPAFDVFAMSSLWEGCPLAALEAMAAGLPVVAPDVAGVGEIIVEDFTGYIVPKSDFEALADALCRVIESGRAAEMGAAARHRVQTYHSLDGMIEQIERAYIDRREFIPKRVATHTAR